MKTLRFMPRILTVANDSNPRVGSRAYAGYSTREFRRRSGTHRAWLLHFASCTVPGGAPTLRTSAEPPLVGSRPGAHRADARMMKQSGEG